MTFKRLIYLISSDLYRYDNRKNTIRKFLRYFMFTPGFNYSCHMRVYKYLIEKPILCKLKYLFIIRLKNYTYKYGIQIPMETDIDEGLLIRHFGGIFINPQCKIGKNFIISQGVTLGINKSGVPTIGDDVWICPGAKVIGGITIGNNVTIGANSVVTKDVPSNVTVVGNNFIIDKKKHN